MFQEVIAERAADLITHRAVAGVEPAESDVWEKAAEDCVLTRLKSLRVYGGLPLHKPLLTPKNREARLKALLGLWANGCTFAVDEDLFADILKRQRMTKDR